MHPAVLIIEDESTLARNLQTYLTRLGMEVRTVESAEAGIELLDAFKPEVVLLDYNLPGCDGLEALRRIRALDAQVRVVLITGYGSTELAVNAMKAGAADYLSKPLALGEIKLLLERLIGQQQLEGTVDYYRHREAQSSGIQKILGESPAIESLKRTLRTLLDAERQMTEGQAPVVLITGETGTGKELVARALHFDGQRSAQPFIELNCGALPASLIEAELFGYERGAFTDARQRKAGLAETANGGTLFLDEIGDTEPALQVKLLRLIEQQTVRRLGGLREQRVNVRVVSATNRPLPAMVQAGQFRADLFYRLRMVELRMPPLRERDRDVVLLARHFLAACSARYRKDGLRLAARTEQVLLQYPWPGNVRELRNVIEQAVLLAPGSTIEPEDLPLARSAAPVEAPGAEPDLNLERIERAAIQRALALAHGNVTQAARLLGVSRDTLRYRLEKSPAMLGREPEPG